MPKNAHEASLPSEKATQQVADEPSKSIRKRSARLKIIRLIRPHWQALSIALLAVLGETVTDVLEPWPIKIVVDNIVADQKVRRDGSRES